jgi:hypothetical protein
MRFSLPDLGKLDLYCGTDPLVGGPRGETEEVRPPVCLVLDFSLQHG